MYTYRSLFAETYEVIIVIEHTATQPKKHLIHTVIGQSSSRGGGGGGGGEEEGKHLQPG